MGHKHHQARKSWTCWILVGSVIVSVLWVTIGGHSSIKASPRTEFVEPTARSSTPQGAAETYTSPDRESFKAFYDLLRNHPHEGVRGEFRELVNDRQMYIFTGALGLVTGMFGRGQDESGDIFSALILDSNLLLVQNRSLAQLTLYHEYLHYLQWRDGTIAEDAFFLRATSLPPDDVGSWCTEKWHAERLAYHEACEFGRTHDLLADLGTDGPLQVICAADEEQFIPTLKRVFQLAEPSHEICAQTWDAI